MHVQGNMGTTSLSRPLLHMTVQLKDPPPGKVHPTQSHHVHIGREKACLGGWKPK